MKLRRIIAIFLIISLICGSSSLPVLAEVKGTESDLLSGNLGIVVQIQYSQ